MINSTPNSSKRNTSLMKTLFLCQLMPGTRKRCAVVGPDPCWHPVLSHGRFADRPNLAEVHMFAAKSRAASTGITGSSVP